MADEQPMQSFILQTFIQLSRVVGRAYAAVNVCAVIMACALLATSIARADGVLNSDFVFQLSNSVLQTPDLDLTTLLNSTSTLTLPDRVVTTTTAGVTIPVNVSGINVSLSYKFATPYQYPKLGTEMNLASTDLSGTIKIAKLAVDAEGDEIRNGMQVHWKLQGLCTDIVVALPSGSAQMTGALDLLVGSDGLPSLTIPWFQVNWTDGAWKVQSMNCSGADNFSAAAKNGLESYLKSSSGFASQFKSAIDSLAQTYQKTARTKLLAPITLDLGVSGLTAILTPAKIVTLVGEQFQIRGNMALTFASSSYNNTVAVTESSALPTQTGYTLSLPSTFLSAFNSMAYASGFYNIQKQGSAIASFQALRTSAIELSFVWTEITKVSLARDFIFDFTPNSLPSLSPVVWDGTASLTGTLDTAMTINTLVQDPTGTGYGNFNQITTPVSAAYTLSFTQETAGPTLNIAFSRFNLSLLGFWDPAYIAANPSYNSTFDAASIGTNLSSSMTSSPTQKLVGTFSLTSTLSLKPSAFRTTGNWLLLDLTP